MLKGTCPTVVDHMHNMRAAWKKSTDCGVVNSILDTRDRAHSYNLGARIAASSSEVCRIAIKQHAQNRIGDLRTRGSNATASLAGWKMIQRP